MLGKKNRRHLESHNGRFQASLYLHVSKDNKIRNLDLLHSLNQLRLKKETKVNSLRAHGSLRLCHAISIALILLSQNHLWLRKIKSGALLRKIEKNKNHRMILKLPQPNLILRNSQPDENLRKRLRAQLNPPRLPLILALNRPKIQRKSLRKRKLLRKMMRQLLRLSLWMECAASSS